MGVFDDAAADIFGDEDTTVAASFRRPPYTWQACRVILSQPTEVFGTARAGTLEAEILAGAIIDTPQRGDELLIAGTTYTIDGAERDVLALSWRLTLADRN